MCDLLNSICLCCMYINDWQILDFWYTLKKQARYQPVTDCTYWPVLGSYNNWNIIQLTPKSTPFEEFDEIHQIVIDVISDNMASLVQSGMYGDINTYDTTTNVFYVIQFISEEYTPQKIYTNLWTSYFCWLISCQGTIFLLREIKF